MHKRAIAKIIRKLLPSSWIAKPGAFFMREVTVVQIRTTLFVAFSPTLQSVKRNSTHHRQAISYFPLTLNRSSSRKRAQTSRMSGTSSNPTAKLQEDKKPEIDPAKTSQQPSQPNILEEDDEFEDFPVEGELHPSIISRSLRQMRAVLT
jgi:hypothetical protein